MISDRPLAGRVALVTGVSRRAGIGHAIARRLLVDGARVLASGWAAHDAEMPWGEDPGGLAALLELAPRERLAYQAVDLADPAAAAALVDAVVELFGGLDILVANHARSSIQSLEELSAAELDHCWAVNVRATLLLVQAFAARRARPRAAIAAAVPDPPGRGSAAQGRVILFTSGQHLAPMPGELPYAATKGAVHQITASLADALAGDGITVNCINPGPTDTGWASPELHARLAARFPARRWGQPDDVARLVAWLASDEAAWITGQVINSEGGWRR
jgi:3-oxoacyl-[acyl-carrier protein] reductase